MDSEAILNEILRFFIKNKSRSCYIEQIMVTGQTQHQILAMITNSPAIFQVLRINETWLIKVNFNIKSCKKYNSKIHCDHDKCQMLHICKEKLMNSKCLKEKCNLNHTLKHFQTKKLLENLNLNGDLGLILTFFQTFYDEEDDDKSVLSKATINSASCEIKEEIKIRLPKNFIENGNRRKLMELFSDSSKTGGGPIRKCKYLAEKWKAYIAFEDDSIAEKLINFKEVTYQNYRFKITKANSNIEKDSFPNEEIDLTLFDKMQPILTNIKTTNFLIFKNVQKSKNKIDLLKYGALVAKLAPISANLIDNENGMWKVEFDKNLDYDEMEKNFQLIKNILPSSIIMQTKLDENFNEIEPKSNEFISQMNDINLNYFYDKKLKTNIFFQMVLKEQNQPWKNELIEVIQNFNCSFHFDTEILRVIPNEKPNRNVGNWKNEVEKIFNNFFRNFETKKLLYDLSNLEMIYLIKKKIEELKHDFKIDYFDDANESKFYFLLKKINFKKLKEKCPQIGQLIENQANNNGNEMEDTNKLKTFKNDKKRDFSRSHGEKSLINKSIKFSQMTYHSYKSLCYNFFEKLKFKYSLEDYSIDKDLILYLTGTEANVNKSIELVNKLPKYIKTRKIDGMNAKFFKCPILGQIVDDLFLSLGDRMFSLNVKLIDQSVQDLPGFYVTYVQNLPELDCSDDSVFEQASSFIKENVDLEEMNVTNFSDLIISEKWKLFEQENFRSDLTGPNFWFSKYPGINNQNFILLCGKKDYVQINKMKIESFLANNEKNLLEIPIDFVDAEFFKLTSKEDLNKLEKKYEAKIEVICDHNGQSSKLVARNHSKNLDNIIENELMNLKRAKQTLVFNSEFIPGFDIVLNNKKLNIQTAIAKIQDDTRTVIQYSLIKQKESEDLNLNEEKNQVNEKSHSLFNYFNSYFSIGHKSANQNKFLKSLKINKSVLTLETGCMTQTKTNVIVSTNSSSLNLGSGILSKIIIQAAGNSVINEAKNKYPNGIENNSIAITSAGNINGVKNLYHAALSGFRNEATALRDIESIINTSLIELKTSNLKSISFPAIGAGGFGFPSNLVAQHMIKIISDFFKSNDCALDVNIVLHEKETELIKTFENEFSMFENSGGKANHDEKKLKDINHKIHLCNLKAKGKFTIHFKSKIDFNRATSEINTFLNEEFKREQMNESSMKNLTSLTVVDLQKLLVKFPDIEITYENKTLNLYGFKNSISCAIAELALQVNNKMAGHFSSMIDQMKISTDIQWQYLSDSNDWKNFSVYLNSLIESNYLKKESKVSFTNESNNSACIFFNMNPMIYLIENKRINVRRIDMSQLDDNSIKIPSNWISINSGSDFYLADLNPSSSEYLRVSYQFISKLQNNSVRISKIQRVENPYLFKQYQLFKEKFIKVNKNPNEIKLFHGSTQESLLKICRFGFNRSYCGKNGVAFGQGVYFAVNSSYSINYSVGHAISDRCMILAKVLVGESCVGNSQMRVPPNQPNSEIPFDSTCDQGKSIFVCYHDNQCYPEFLIYFN